MARAVVLPARGAITARTTSSHEARTQPVRRGAGAESAQGDPGVRGVDRLRGSAAREGRRRRARSVARRPVRCSTSVDVVRWSAGRGRVARTGAQVEEPEGRCREEDGEHGGDGPDEPGRDVGHRELIPLRASEMTKSTPKAGPVQVCPVSQEAVCPAVQTRPAARTGTQHSPRMVNGTAASRGRPVEGPIAPLTSSSLGRPAGRGDDAWFSRTSRTVAGGWRRVGLSVL